MSFQSLAREDALPEAIGGPPYLSRNQPSCGVNGRNRLLNLIALAERDTALNRGRGRRYCTSVIVVEFCEVVNHERETEACIQVRVGGRGGSSGSGATL